MSDECWINSDPTTVLPAGTFMFFNNLNEEGAIGTHSLTGLPCGEIIHEDDPRWDCATMGNQICGTVTSIGEPPAVPQLPETGTASGAIAIAGSLALVAGVILHRISNPARRNR